MSHYRPVPKQDLSRRVVYHWLGLLFRVVGLAVKQRIRFTTLVFLCLLAAAGFGQSPRPAGKPLSKEKVLDLVRNYVPAERVADLVRRYGIDFEPTEDYLEKLRKAGRKDVDVLIKALRTASGTNTPAPSATATQPAPESPKPTTETQAKQRMVHVKELADQGNWDAAVGEAREVLRLDPNNSDAHSYVAYGLDLKGDFGGAMAECHQALRLDPNNAYAYSNLGRALESKGDLQGALEEYRRAYLLAPNDPALKGNYERLLSVVKK